MYLTPKQAALRACVSVGLIYHWCQSGELPCYRVGKRGSRGKILIDPADLDRLLVSLKSCVLVAPLPKTTPVTSARSKHLSFS